MQTATSHAEHQRLQAVAEDYRRRGYQVFVEPSAQEMPEFLKGYRPDLILEGPDESVVVEVKKSRRSKVEAWQSIAETVQRQPGWRFEIVAAPASDEPRLKNLTDSEIRHRLDTSSQLAATGDTSAALVLTWAAAEAAMRLILRRYKVEVPDDAPGTVITRLYSEGLLDRRDYDLLTSSLAQRNAVVHGYRRKVNPQDITRLQGTVKRVLAERQPNQNHQKE